MPTTDFLEAWSEIGQKDADPKIDLYIAFGKDPVMHGTVGLAWTGGACKDYHSPIVCICKCATLSFQWPRRL